MIEFNNIPAEVVKVDNPDHPFAFDGPDILLYTTKGLLAIFYLRLNEQKNPNRLVSRLINSMLVYPAYTQMLFLYDHTKDIPNILEKFYHYFNRIIEPKDMRNAKSILNDKKNEGEIKRLKNIQNRIFKDQSIVQRVNISNIKKIEFSERKKIPELKIKDFSYSVSRAKYYDRIKEKEVIVNSNIFEYEDQFFATKSLSKNVSDLRQFRPFYEFAINSELTIDDRVPNFQRITRKIIGVNDFPKIRFDPYKPSRIASLFGWELIISDNFSEIQNIIPKSEYNYEDSKRQN